MLRETGIEVMFVIKILLPFLYCILVGTAYSMAFKRKFIDSLAPAFFIQIILMIVSGIVVEKLSVGIMLGVICSSMTIYAKLVREKSFDAIKKVYLNEKGTIEWAVIMFIIMYGVIFILNVGKHYNMWDEFSHWGWFVRESYQNDALFCISEHRFEHKDYVPGVSLFEALWCTLSLKFSEANSYRGIQMLQAAMIMPVACRIEEKKYRNSWDKIVKLIVNLVIVFGIPLFSKVPFYHTIYQDLILGVFVFYCVWIVASEEFSNYSLFVFGLSLCNMIMCKLTAVAFVPVLFLLYTIYHHKYSSKAISRIKIWLGTIIAVVLSIVPYGLYGFYLDKYNIGGSAVQGYSSISLKKIVDVITHNGNIAYQAVVDREYLRALATDGIIGKLSYIWIILGASAIVFLLMLLQDDRENKSKLKLISLWILLVGVYYAIVMYVMYMVMFSEYEATGLASYSRYMSTFVLATLLIVAMVIIRFTVSRARFIPALVAAMLVENIVVLFGANQLLPGVLAGDEIWNEGHIDYLNDSLPTGADLLFVTSVADMEAGRLSFYCPEIQFTCNVYGTQLYDGDVWSKNMSLNEFVDEITNHEYIYLFSYDDSFIDLYKDAFESDTVIAPGKLYKVENEDGLIRTTVVE